VKEDEMKKRVLCGAILAALVVSLPAAAVDDQGIPDDSLGLSKSSVYDVPEPAAITYGEQDPGSVGKRAARSYNTAPPMIPHSIQDMTPITRDMNLCKDCHLQPDMIGKKVEQGIPVPVSASHYANVKKGELYMGRWNCTQCHRPQAEVDVLVESTFGKKATQR